MGSLVGMVTSSLTVLAAVSSLGTLKLSTWKPPLGALDGVIATWAPAGSPPSVTTPSTSAASTARRIFFTDLHPSAIDVEGSVDRIGRKVPPNGDRSGAVSGAVSGGG